MRAATTYTQSRSILPLDRGQLLLIHCGEIAHLKEAGIILVEKQSKEKCYHANWYTWNTEIFRLSEHIGAAKTNISMCSFWTHLNIDFLYKYFSTFNSSAALGKKILLENQELHEDGWDNLIRQTEEGQSELIDEPIIEPVVSTSPSPVLKKINSFSVTNPHEDNYPAAPKSDNLENQARSSADRRFCPPDFAKKQPVDPEELRQAIAEVRTIECTPNFRINVEIQNAIANNLENVYTAVAYVKEQIRLNVKIKKSCEAMFMWALRTELDSKYDRKEVIEYKQPSEKDKAEIAIALSNGAIKEFSLQPNGLWVVDTGKECLAWYKFFEIF